MYEALMLQVRKVMAETEWDLARCNDMYRLQHILKVRTATLVKALHAASECVGELEATALNDIDMKFDDVYDGPQPF